MKKFNMLVLVCTLLLTLSACTSTNGRESTGQYFDSTAITTKVKAKLADKLGISSVAYVSVNTQKGTVYLTGSVKTAQDKRRATDVAKTVGGVQAVQNELRIGK